MCVVFLLKWRVTFLHQKFCQYFSKINNFCVFQILTPSLVTLVSQVSLPSRDATQLEGLTVYPSDKEALPSTGYNCKESPAHSKSMASTSFMEPRIKEVVQKSLLCIVGQRFVGMFLECKEKRIQFDLHITPIYILITCKSTIFQVARKNLKSQKSQKQILISYVVPNLPITRK